MSTPRAASKAYALALFAIVSVACGLLVAGLVLPGTLLLTNSAKATSTGLESLPADLTIQPQMERSRILLKDGTVLAEFYDQNRIYKSLANISPIMQKAQVAIEDHEFYQHGAIYLQGTLRALLRDTAGGSTQGGSTLTQQYVKQALIENALIEGDQNAVDAAQAQTLQRKVRELRYAIALEKKYSKQQILERYLNIAYYGDGAYGVEAAAHHYFNTTAKNLTLAESALLAGIVQNPDAYNPVNHPVAALNRRNTVLYRMQQLGIITKAQYTAAKKQTFNAKLVKTSQVGCVGSKFPFICQYAYNTIVQKMTSLGKTNEARKNALYRGGLTIKTVIDPTVQTNAQKGLSSYVAATDPVISVGVTLQPQTGLITSMVQSRPTIGTGTGQTWINYAVEQSMGGAEGYQAGSTFKAFTMAAALAKGLGIGTSYNSPSPFNASNLSFAGCTGSMRAANWNPRNSTSSGYFNMQQAADFSVNTYFVQLEHAAGLCNTIKAAEAAGVKSATGLNLETNPTTDVPSFTLGSVEVTPLSMASAYATFANHGIHCDPIILASATNKAGKSLSVPSANCQQAISAKVADAVTKVLYGVMHDTNATGVPARVSGYTYQAGKTGTTEGHEAVWLDGYTANVAGAAVIVADKQAARFKGKSNRSITGLRVHGTSCPSYGCYIQGHGGTDAGRVWKAVMKAALAGTADTKFNSVSSSLTGGSSSGKTSLPSVSGMTLSAARQALQDAGFSTYVWRVSSSYPAGTFLGISPSYSATPGSAIALLVSSGSSGSSGNSGGSGSGSGTSTGGSTHTAVATRTTTATATATKTATATATRTATATATATKTTAQATATTKPTTKTTP